MEIAVTNTLTYLKSALPLHLHSQICIYIYVSELGIVIAYTFTRMKLTLYAQ